MCTSEPSRESWGSGSAYELWVGRWSRLVAEAFIDWLAVASGQAWGDVGCGTGALAECILGRSNPARVLGVDRSEAYVAEAWNRVRDPRVRFEVGDACALTWANATCDVTVSGLVLNFVPDADAMVREMVRVTRPGGRVAAYVWDYAGGMQMIRHFWDVALELNGGDSGLDQAERFPLCRPGPLEQLFRRTGLGEVSVRAIDVPTVFRDFDDYWRPFLGRQGAAPTYLASLPGDVRDRIRDALKSRLVAAPDGSIAMTARAWTVQGTVPPNPSSHPSGSRVRSTTGMPSSRAEPLPRNAGHARLRRLTAADLPHFLAYRQDPVVGRYQGWSPMSEVEASTFIDEMAVAELFRPEGWVQLAIARSDDDALVGDMGLFVARAHAFAEIGFTLAPAGQGRGYATAAVAAAIELLFESTTVPSVVGVTDARNTPSIRVLERAGMRRVESRATIFKGEPCTEWVFARQR